MGRRVLVNSQWLFPELAEKVVTHHDRYFRENNRHGRPLGYRDLQKYGDYPVGWRTNVDIFGKDMDLDVLLRADTPFSEPKIALPNGNYHLVWPHFEKGNLLCLRSSADTIDHGAGTELTKYFIREACRLLEDSFSGKNKSDFVTEFKSYWDRWVSVRKNSRCSVWMLAKTAPPSRKVYTGTFGRGNGIKIVSDNVEDGLRMANAIFNNKNIKPDVFKPSALIWMDHPLIPEKFPKHNAHVADIARSSSCFDMLLSLVPDEIGEMHVIFGFDTENGPAMGAIRLCEPIASKDYRGKPVYLRNKGNRPKAVKTTQVKKRYFSAQGKAEPMAVQRIGREWVFERGGRGLNPRLDSARVCMIGCGSLGAQVAKYLVQSGVRKLVLVDPDCLSWDNIGRHLLGADVIREKKALGLKKYLDSHFPAMLEIEAQPHEWQELIVDDEKVGLILESNIVISTMGNWDAEASLNYAFNTYVDFPPVLFGWTEPFGVAGHAISVTGLGGCLACGMSPKGRFKYAISQWDTDKTLRRSPACGETYQPYGVIDIAPIHAMIARLAIDIILGKNKTSTHHAWVGRLNDIMEAGGGIWDGVNGYYGDLGSGYRYFEKQWLLNKSCFLGH